MNSLALLFAITVNWVAPTQNTDGTPLTDLAYYRIYYGTEQGVYVDNILIPDPSAVSHEFTPAPGDYYVAMTAVDEEGNESQYSNEVLKNEPYPPGMLPMITLAADTPAYTVIKQYNRLVLVPIGTAPAGAQCNPNFSVNGHGVVDNQSVQWAPGSSARPIVVVALCDG